MSKLFRLSLSRSEEPPVSPFDVVNGSRTRGVGFTLPTDADDDKRQATVETRSRTSSQSSVPSLKTPRTARFAEATTVHSPVDTRSPFGDYPRMATQATPSDVGFGYMADNDAARNSSYPPETPLRSALKTPGTPGRHLNPLSPTFREEQMLDAREESTEKTQAKDLVGFAQVMIRVLH